MSLLEKVFGTVIFLWVTFGFVYGGIRGIKHQEDPFRLGVRRDLGVRASYYFMIGGGLCGVSGLLLLWISNPIGHAIGVCGVLLGFPFLWICIYMLWKNQPRFRW